MKQISHVDEIIDESFGLWISSLFSSISGWNPGILFREQKEVFFWLLRYLLKTGKIKFITPGVDCYVSLNNPEPHFSIYDHDAQWQASPDEIIHYLKTHWPDKVSEENDLELSLYFYEMPSVIWVRDTGMLVAS